MLNLQHFLGRDGMMITVLHLMAGKVMDHLFINNPLMDYHGENMRMEYMHCIENSSVHTHFLDM